VNGTVFIVTGAAAVAAGIGVFVVWVVLRRRAQPSLRLAGTVLLAAGVFALVTGWLVTDKSVTTGDAVRTGGLAAGSVVALYALWLNDRRRRVDEDRQELEHRRQDLESDRAEHDRQRAADERFLRAIELLGHDTDQVRVGALHALAGLARAQPAYTQDVLDVLCAYLRRPFDHPYYEVLRGDATDMDAEWRERRQEADLWRQVRTTAQRLIADLLPVVGTEDAPAYDLDLSGASLEYFDISHRVVGQLRARWLRLYESNSFHHCEFRGPVWFTKSQAWGRLYLNDATFADRSWFSTVTAHDVVDLSRVRFGGATKFADSTFTGPVTFHDAWFAENIDLSDTTFGNDLDLRVREGLIGSTLGMRVSTDHEHHLPEGWDVDPPHASGMSLVRA
jgi:drug/metabolite transporter superfamily protein YnfA